MKLQLELGACAQHTETEQTQVYSMLSTLTCELSYHRIQVTPKLKDTEILFCYDPRKNENNETKLWWTKSVYRKVLLKLQASFEPLKELRIKGIFLNPIGGNWSRYYPVIK